MTPIESRAILPFLKAMQLRHLLQSLAGLLGGMLFCLVGPMLLLLSYLLISTTLMATYGFWRTYWIIAGISLPLSFLIAWRLRGSVLEQMVPDEDTLSGRWMRRTVAPMLILVEIAVGGPRLVLWATDRLRGHWRVRRIGLGRIAQAVAELTNAHEGISPAKLLFPAESAKQLEPILAFLLYHEIVDLSKRGDRVWLTTDFRRRFDSYRTAR